MTPSARGAAPPTARGVQLRRLGVLSVPAACALLLAGCGGRSGPSIVLYNGQHTQLTSALVGAFEKRTGIQVEIHTNDSLVLADQLLEEGSASPADVYISENSPELVTLSEHGLLAKLGPSILNQVPTGDNAPDGDWVGMALRVSVLVYDPALISGAQLPRSVLALAQPRFKGKIAIAPIDSDFPPLVGAVIDAYGTKVTTGWLDGLKSNAQTYQDDEAVVAAVNRGDVALGVINQYYWYRLRLELKTSAMHSALYYFPAHNVGSITNISGAAILSSSTHKADAERFLAFVVSKTGQGIIAHSDDFEYPARPGVAANNALPPLASIDHATLTVTELGDDQQAARMLEQSGLA